MAEIGIEKKSGTSWLWWIIGLVVVALLVWWLVGTYESNKANAAAVPDTTTAVQTMPAAPVPAPAAPAARPQ